MQNRTIIKRNFRREVLRRWAAKKGRSASGIPSIRMGGRGWCGPGRRAYRILQNAFQRVVLFHEGRFSPLGPRGIRRPASLLGFGPTTSRHIVHDRLHRRRAQLRAIPKHLDHCVEGRVPFEPKARIPAGQRNQLTVGALASARRRPQLPFCKIQPRPFGPTAFRQAYRRERLRTRGPSRAATFKLRHCRIGAPLQIGRRSAGVRIEHQTIRGSPAFSFTASRLLVPGPATSWMAILSSSATTPRSTSRSGKTAIILRPICTNRV